MGGLGSGPDSERQANEGGVDWEALRAAAVAASKCSYSLFALPGGRGRFCRRRPTGLGCECRERVLRPDIVCRMFDGLGVARKRRGRLVSAYCVDGNGEALMPCGRCRQLLYEHGGPDLLIMTPEGVRTMAQILPQPFGPWDLAERKAARDD